MRKRVIRLSIVTVLLLTLLGAPSFAAAAPQAPASDHERFIVVARGAGDYDKLRQEVARVGGSVVKDMRGGNMLVVNGPTTLKRQIESTGLSKGVAKDHIETLVRPDARVDLTNSSQVHSRRPLSLAQAQAQALGEGRLRSVTGDPAFLYPGLMWSIERIGAPRAWQKTTGSPLVTVGVADTGLDFTHAELAPNITDVVDLTVSENPPICKTFFPNPFDPTQPGIGDADLAAMFGGPETTDWYGHGSWIGGNIAAVLNGQGVNGIAPSVKLVSLKISQWCGSAYDSTIMDAFLYAGDHHIDVVSISFGGYLELADPDQAVIWGAYIQTVQRVRDQGTLIVASAGNEHVQVGPFGLVTSHGPLTTPGIPLADLYGQFEAPGGIPGVVDVSSSGNVVVPSRSTCLRGSTGSASKISATCKPTSDTHQAAGQGKQNQLAYYSNYGPRIDLTGPGGARKFNLPFWDRGGTLGFPDTSSDFTTAFGDFGTTSNWALLVPCFVFTGGGFPANQCYSTIQGTSMAAPHVSATAALVASARPEARHNPDRLVSILKSRAQRIEGNQTEVLSATDTSPADLLGTACPTGYCHLGGPSVPDSEAYGAGLVDAARAVPR